MSYRQSNKGSWQGSQLYELCAQCMRFDRSELWDLTSRTLCILKALVQLGRRKIFGANRISFFLNDGEKYNVTQNKQQRFIMTPEHSLEVHYLGSDLRSSLKSHKSSRQSIKCHRKSEGYRPGRVWKTLAELYNWTIFSLIVECWHTLDSWNLAQNFNKSDVEEGSTLEKKKKSNSNVMQ